MHDDRSKENKGGDEKIGYLTEKEKDEQYSQKSPELNMIFNFLRESCTPKPLDVLNSFYGNCDKLNHNYNTCFSM
jgi:hypothetical protein